MSKIWGLDHPHATNRPSKITVYLRQKVEIYIIDPLLMIYIIRTQCLDNPKNYKPESISSTFIGEIIPYLQ